MNPTAIIQSKIFPNFEDPSICSACSTNITVESCANQICYNWVCSKCNYCKKCSLVHSVNPYCQGCSNHCNPYSKKQIYMCLCCCGNSYYCDHCVMFFMYCPNREGQYKIYICPSCLPSYNKTLDENSKSIHFKKPKEYFDEIFQNSCGSILDHLLIRDICLIVKMYLQVQ
jgi:hypothetical protein